MRFCSAARISGRRSSKADGMARVLSKQKADLVLRLFTLLQKDRDGFRRGMNEFLRLSQVQQCSDAAALTRLNELQRGPPRLERPPGNLQFVIQLAQGDV